MLKLHYVSPCDFWLHHKPKVLAAFSLERMLVLGYLQKYSASSMDLWCHLHSDTILMLSSSMKEFGANSLDWTFSTLNLLNVVKRPMHICLRHYSFLHSSPPAGTLSLHFQSRYQNVSSIWEFHVRYRLHYLHWLNNSRLSIIPVSSYSVWSHAFNRLYVSCYLTVKRIWEVSLSHF